MVLRLEPCAGQGLSATEGDETPESAEIRAAIFNPTNPRAGETTVCMLLETLLSYKIVIRGASS